MIEQAAKVDKKHWKARQPEHGEKKTKTYLLGHIISSKKVCLIPARHISLAFRQNMKQRIYPTRRETSRTLPKPALGIDTTHSGRRMGQVVLVSSPAVEAHVLFSHISCL
ncbi:hypothetical protein EMCG_00957 [[Emmonsia] crescens]|uniref:Uncharacterized protein n=1 Tax=[Emmonsia] crescens TaxID=73230 RepID=A0A0G2IXC8_9EURO|nr:hypothetical protein EMCG_00957 [Emmonsia crescens UAMH 3008]